MGLGSSGCIWYIPDPDLREAHHTPGVYGVANGYSWLSAPSRVKPRAGFSGAQAVSKEGLGRALEELEVKGHFRSGTWGQKGAAAAAGNLTVQP